jgi:hypothetical protein
MPADSKASGLQIGWDVVALVEEGDHEAETMLSAGDLDGAAREAFVARLITARALLTGQTGPWLEYRRRLLADLRIRSLEALGIGLSPATRERHRALLAEAG